LAVFGQCFKLALRQRVNLMFYSTVAGRAARIDKQSAGAAAARRHFQDPDELHH